MRVDVTGESVTIGRQRGGSDFVWALGRITRKAAISAPPVEVHLWLAAARGRYVLPRAVPGYLLENLAGVFPEWDSREIDRLAKRHLRFRRQMYLNRVLPLQRGFKASGALRMEGGEHLAGTLEGGRGAILVTGHMGFARLIAPVLRREGWRVRVVVSASDAVVRHLRRRDQWLDAGGQLRRDVYRRTRVRVDPIDGEAIRATLDVRPIFEALSRNEVVLFAGDGLRAAAFERMELLGKPYPFPTGFMRIAMLTRAPVLPVWALPGGVRKIVVRILPPLPVKPDYAVSGNLRLFAGALDDRLRVAPHLWYRWSETPDLFRRVIRWSESDPGGRHVGDWRLEAV